MLINSKLYDQCFFDKTYTNALKGLVCLIVIYVHIHHGYGNALQDAIGSFAYVCVSFFFLVSAYGMMFSSERKADYLQHFWRNRLLSLLIPCALINIVHAEFSAWQGHNEALSLLYTLNKYVSVLLQWCVWFYLVMICKRRFFPDSHRLSDALLIGGVIVTSLCLYCFSDKTVVSARQGWCFERMGLVWGVLLYRHFERVKQWMTVDNVKKILVLLLLTVVCGMAYLKYKNVVFLGQYLLKILLGFVMLLTLFTATHSHTIGCNKASQFLGDISYEVYLSHGMIMGVLAYFLPELPSGQFIFFTVFFTVVFSACVHAVAGVLVKRLRA